MRTLATLMASITVLTFGLFAHALAGADREPATPVVSHQTGPHQTSA
jgi:hypothetical protein